MRRSARRCAIALCRGICACQAPSQFDAQGSRRRIGQVFAIAEREADGIAAVGRHLQPAQGLRIGLPRPTQHRSARAGTQALLERPQGIASEASTISDGAGRRLAPATPAHKEYRAARSRPRSAWPASCARASATPARVRRRHRRHQHSVNARFGQPRCGSAASSSAWPVGSPVSGCASGCPRHTVCAVSKASRATAVPITAAPISPCRTRPQYRPSIAKSLPGSTTIGA